MSQPKPRIHVLDTNVLMHDPTSLFRFAEHDVFIPMVTLEELDNNKKGTSEVARNARQASRFLDEVVSRSGSFEEGFPLSLNDPTCTGKLLVQTSTIKSDLPDGLSVGKNDNQIIGVVKHLQEATPDCKIVLVSKDINVRIKAHVLGLNAEDYRNDKVLEDTDILYTGTQGLPTDFWDECETTNTGREDGRILYHFKGPFCSNFTVNEFVFDEHISARVTKQNGATAAILEVTNYTHKDNAVWGIVARNREQNFALNLLMDPEIDCVTLLGQAGSGKTLLTLAAALEQTMGNKLYSEIIFTRVTVPVGEDIGFLPGTEEEKMNPWMGALQDNLDVLNTPNDEAGEWGRAATQDLIRSRIKVKSLNFMRGRTFLKKFLIIDEAQNLTSKQMKTLITRAGPGTKVVCLGNIAQIDTPYLTESSSGLTYVVDRFRGWEHYGNVTLIEGERSRLASRAGEVL